MAEDIGILAMTIHEREAAAGVLCLLHPKITALVNGSCPRCIENWQRDVNFSSPPVQARIDTEGKADLRIQRDAYRRVVSALAVQHPETEQLERYLELRAMARTLILQMVQAAYYPLHEDDWNG